MNASTIRGFLNTRRACSMMKNGVGVNKFTADFAGVVTLTATVDRDKNKPVKAAKERLDLPLEAPISKDQERKRSEAQRDALLKYSGAQYRLGDAPVNHNNSILAEVLEDATPTAHHRAVDRYFRNMPGDGGGANIARNALKEAIANAIPDATPPNPLAKSENMSYLTLALAGALGKGKAARNPAAAAHVLACMQGMDLAGIIRGTAQMPPRPANLQSWIKWESIQRAAWNAAYALATTTKGYATLQMVANSNDGGIKPADTRKLKNFLNAAHLKLEEMKRSMAARIDMDPDPAALLKHARSRRSLVGDALQGDHSVLSGSSWDELKTSSPMHAYASSAVRNGFTEDSPNSDLQKAMQRANKMTTWVDRAIKRYNDRSYDAGIRAMNYVLPSKRKSPLTAMLNAGDVKNLHNHCIGESKAAEIACDQLLKAYIDILDDKEAALVAHATSDGPVNPDQLQADKAILMESCIRASILKASDTFRGIRGRYQARPMQESEKDEARNRLKKYAEEMSEHLDEAELLKAFDDFTAVPITLNSDTLDEWAYYAFMKSHAGQSAEEVAAKFLTPLPGSTASADPTDSTGSTETTAVNDHDKTDWLLLVDALNRVRGEVSEVRLEDHLVGGKLTLNGLIEYSKRIAGGNELGSSLTTSASSTVGITSKNFLTATLADLFYMVSQAVVPVSINGQFTATGSRDAYVNLSIPAIGVTLEMGSQQKGLVQVGVSVFAGYHVKTPLPIEGGQLGLTAGGSLGLAASYEETKKNSVILRLGRTGRSDREDEPDGRSPRLAGLAGDTQAKEEFNAIIETAMSPLSDEDKKRGFTSPLQKVLASSDDISLTWQDEADFRDRKLKGAASVTGSGIASMGRWRAGVSGNVTGVYTHQNESWQVSQERQGTTRTRVEKAVHSFALSGGIGVNGAAVNAYSNNAFRTIGTGAADASANVEFYQRSMMVKRCLIFSGGDVTPSSFVSYTHQTANGFAESVLKQIDRWTKTEVANMLGQMPEDLRPTEGSEEYREIEREARETIRQFVAQAQANAQPYKSHTEWLQLNKDKANEANKHLTNAKLAGFANDQEEAAKEEEIAIRIQRDPDNWDPILLFTSKALSEGWTQGIPNIGLIANSSQSLDIANLETMT
jgi:hypothetical protein